MCITKGRRKEGTGHWGLGTGKGKTFREVGVAASSHGLEARGTHGVRHAMARFGRCLGIAFQIQDDLLDLVGKENVVGKSVHKDVEKGKMTLPVIHHLANASPHQRGQTLTLLEHASGDTRHAAQQELIAALESTGSIAASRASAAKFVDHAKQELGTIQDSPAKELLRVMADSVVGRAY